MKRLVSSEIIQLMTIQVNYELIEKLEVSASKKKQDIRMTFTAPFGGKEDYFRFISRIVNYLFNVKKFKKLESNESNVSQDSHYIVFQAFNGKQYRIDVIYDLRVSTHENNNEYAKDKHKQEIKQRYQYLNNVTNEVECRFINITINNKEFFNYDEVFDYFVNIIQSEVIDDMNNAIFK